MLVCHVQPASLDHVTTATATGYAAPATRFVGSAKISTPISPLGSTPNAGRAVAIPTWKINALMATPVPIVMADDLPAGAKAVSTAIVVVGARAPQQASVTR